MNLKLHRAPWPARLLYTQNPFYLISACLVLLGVSHSLSAVPGDVAAARAGGAALAAYSLLLAVAGCLIARWGRVWEDARSILLLIIMQLAALSVCFDELCLRSPQTAAPWLALGLGFAIALSETLLRALQLPFGPLWRAPYYTLLALLFAAPLWVSPGWLGERLLPWRVLAFPALAAAALMTLLPAVRWGRRQAELPGHPWRWPLYPWTVFGMLAACLGTRSYLLSLSFVVDKGLQTIFAPYFLVPLALALAVLLFEGSMRAPRRQRIILMLAPLMLLLTGCPHGAAAVSFWNELRQTLGDPTWLTVVALAAFYGGALLRGVAAAEYGLAAMLLLACPLHAPPRWEVWLPAGAATPLLVLAVLQLAWALDRHSSLRFLAGGVALVGAGWIALPRPLPGVTPDVAACLGLLLAVLLGGWLFRDPFARRLRCLGALLLAAAPWAAAATAPLPSPTSWIAASAALLLGLLGRLQFAENWWLLPADSSCLAVVAGLAASGHGPLDAALGSRSALLIEAGLACLLVALAISAVKAGALPHLRRWLLFRVRWRAATPEESGPPPSSPV